MQTLRLLSLNLEMWRVFLATRKIILDEKNIPQNIINFSKTLREFPIQLSGNSATCPISMSLDEVLYLIASIDLEVNHNVKMFLR